jgi:hypothetical protein
MSAINKYKDTNEFLLVSEGFIFGGKQGLSNFERPWWKHLQYIV